MKYVTILLLALGLSLGCSSPAGDSTGDGTQSGNTGGKTDNVNQTDGGESGEGADGGWADTDGGPIESDGDLIESDGGDDETDGLGEPATDLFAQAKDVTLHRIEFPEGTEAPPYERAQVTTRFRLSGTEFWQKWTGGLNPTYQYSEGTVFGRRCMFASARRFEAIMNNPPPAIDELRDNSRWSGGFFNWNDDYSQSDWSDGSSARLWAWRTTLIKWISQTNRDGSCYLPTYDMVETAALSCQSRAERSDGEIQGCRAP
jgi:hypothetical protein